MVLFSCFEPNSEGGIIMKLKTLLSGFMVVAMLSLSSNVLAASPEKQSYEGIAYSKVDLSDIGNLENIKVSQEEEKIALSFDLNGKAFDIEALAFDLDNGETNNKFASKESPDGISFNILESNGNITGVAVNTNISPINQTKEDSFGFLISQGVDSSLLKNILNQTKSEHRTELMNSKQEIQSLPSQEISKGISPYSSLHVLASGLSVPFLISGGVAEGWLNTSYSHQQYFNVNNLVYSIAYNWPSDGVSIWYDYLNSSEAYYSPAWPSAGQTSVSGSWVIDATKGMFAAQATVSAFVSGFPLMWTLYDTTEIR